MLNRCFLILMILIMVFVSSCTSQQKEIPDDEDALQEDGLLEQRDTNSNADADNVEDADTLEMKGDESGSAEGDGEDVDLSPQTQTKSLVTGLPSERPYQPVAVMIENSPAARPQSGLIYADVVYEMYVEGKITRFMAIFNDRDSTVAGPVRSVRHYYLDIVREWDALLLHYGGSSFAQDVYKKDKGIKRIDGIYDTKYYWRDKSRKAPHNAYINITECRKEIDSKQKERGFLFTEDIPVGHDYSKVIIPYDSKYTVTSYVFDANKGVHKRFINGSPHVDRESGQQIEVKNIIIQYAKHRSMNTSAGHIDIELVSSGTAEYFINGNHFKGSWKKASKSEKTVFYDQNGQEIMLMPGNTWIQVVPVGFNVQVE